MKIPVLEGNIVCLRSVEPEKDYRQWYEVYERSRYASLDSEYDPER